MCLCVPVHMTCVDDAPERALMDMMHGTLETKRDLSLLEQELVREPWMDLPHERMTDEQQLALALWEKRVKLIRQEQDNRRKLLTADLAKARNDVTDLCRAFDTKLRALHERRVGVLRETYILELVVLKLTAHLEREAQRERQLEQVDTCLALLAAEKQIAAQVCVVWLRVCPDPSHPFLALCCVFVLYVAYNKRLPTSTCARSKR
jgi:hypothetical protein